MAARACWLALACTLVGEVAAGVKPSVFISADVATGGATADGVTNAGFLTYTFHLSEPSGGTAACTGSPTYTTHTGTMTAALTLAEDASLEEHFYAGWTIKTTGGAGSGATGTITAYNPLTRAVTASGITSTDATTTYELTAGTCTAQAAARSTAGSDTGKWKAGMWSNCPAGCTFVGPVVAPEGFRAFVSGPLACTDATVASGGWSVALKCPKNNVAATSQPLTGVDVRRQTIETNAAMTAAAVGQSFEIRDTVVTGTMGAALTLAAQAGADAYYAGWRIETEFPKASGTVLTYTDSSKVITVEWDEPTACDTGFNKDKTTCTPVTTTAATTYTLTADCPFAPTNVPLLTQAKADAGSPFTYQFVPGSITSWEPVTATPFALDYAKCTVHRSVDGLWSAYVPAGAFTDAGGNPNVASTACRAITSAVVTAYGDGADAATVVETAAGAALCNLAMPYQVTSDVTAPTVTVTASDDNWMSSRATTNLANGDRITFKFVISEPPIKTTAAAGLSLPGGAVADGDVTTAHQCNNPVSWGSGAVYYLRCNAIPEGGAMITAAADRTISIAIAADAFTDLAGNGNTALSAFTIISDNQSPSAVTAAATAGGALTSGSMTNADTTFTFTLAETLGGVSTSAVALAPAAVTQDQYPYPITVPDTWASHQGAAGLMIDGVGSTNCNPGTFTVGAGSNLAPTLLCPVLASGGDTWGIGEIAVTAMDVVARTITLAAQETTITGGGACTGTCTATPSPPPCTACTAYTDNNPNNGCKSDPACVWTPGTGPGQTVQLIARYQTGTLATAHASDTTGATVTLPANFDVPGSAVGSAGGTTEASAADFYVGWTIETALPTGKGVVTDYNPTTKVATIAWDSLVTDVGGTTTYKLTAPCSAAPLNTNLIIETVTPTPSPTPTYDIITFREGYAPTARHTDSTGVANTGAADAVAGGEDAGVHGADTDANFAIECALMRPGNRDITVQIPAAQFSDAAGNPNVASEPFLITQDQILPTVAITIFAADGVTPIADGGTTGSRAAVFKIKASEHILSVTTTSGAGLSGMVEGDLTVSGCANNRFWGWKDTYYLRCDWADGATASVALGDTKVKDLAGNQQTPAVTAVTAIFT